jgi:hypothetical protein
MFGTSTASTSAECFGAVSPFSVSLLPFELVSPIRFADRYPLAKPSNHVVSHPFRGLRFVKLRSCVCDDRRTLGIVEQSRGYLIVSYEIMR